MQAAGLTAEVLETAGHPVAYGEWLGAPGAPTVLIYGHHDVQPVDPLDLWTSPPFDAAVRDGKLYGRGAVDDKGQCLMHIAAIEAHLRVNGKLPLNVKVRDRRRRRGRLGELRAVSRAREGAARVRRRRRVRHRGVRRRRPVAHDVAARARRLGDHRARSGDRLALRLFRRHREEPVGSARADHRGAQGRARARRRAGVLRRRARAVADGARGDRGAAVRSRQGSARARRPRAHRRDVAPAARTDVVSPDARGQRHVRRLPRRGLEDDHPVVRDGEADGAARAAPGSRSGEARGDDVRAAHRAQRRARRHHVARRRARRRDVARSSRGRRRRARDGARLRQSAGVHRHRRHDRPGLVVRPHPAPAASADRRRLARRRDPRAQREVRPVAVLRRHRDDDVSLRRARDRAEEE